MADPAVETSVTMGRFYSLMGVNPENIYATLEPLERAILDRLSRELIKDFMDPS